MLAKFTRNLSSFLNNNFRKLLRIFSNRNILSDLSIEYGFQKFYIISKNFCCNFVQILLRFRLNFF